MDYTVIHYQPMTGYWHVESDDNDRPWTADADTCNALAAGYGHYGLDARVVTVASLTVAHAPVTGSLIHTEAE